MITMLSFKNIFATATSLAAILASISALGINCRGNLIGLREIVNNIQPRDRRYISGQQIACTGNLCVSFQNGATGTADQASGFMQTLLGHGCRKCGSCPTQPGKDAYNGVLSVNIFGRPDCQGAC